MARRGVAFQDQVIAIMRNSSKPLSAYDILNKIREQNQKVAPPQVYRALTALTEDGVAHRLESLNRYMVCKCDSHDHPSVLSICDDCGEVEESVQPEVFSQISSVLEKTGFEVQRHVVEVHGTCSDCGESKGDA